MRWKARNVEFGPILIENELFSVTIYPDSQERWFGLRLFGFEPIIEGKRKSFESDVEERLELLDSIKAVYKQRIGEVADAICAEMGAPLKSLAQTMQAGAMLGHLKVMSGILKDYQFHEDQGSTRIQREPIGVCGMITPWNWPIHQIGCPPRSHQASAPMAKYKRKIKLIKPTMQLRLTMVFVGMSALSLLLQFILFMATMSQVALELPREGSA